MRLKKIKRDIRRQWYNFEALFSHIPLYFLVQISLRLYAPVSPPSRKDNDWGISNFPLVAGHEGIGKVRAVGDGCKFLKVGDVVGITWCRDSCANCDKCFQGRENL